MLDRTAIEKETQDTRKQLAAMEKEVKQLRDWMASNERALAGMNETLRRITEDGITKARADLAVREGDLQRMRGIIAHNEKILTRISDIARKRKDIATLEQEQERLIVLLERHRTELRQLEHEYEEMIRPASAPAALVPCEVVLPNNYRIPLDPGKGSYMIGWYDAAAGTAPDIDLHPVGGSAQGVSRQHAVIRLIDGQWVITDLGSTNGTFLNDMRMSPNSSTVIQDRTRIRLGNVIIFFRYITQTTRL
ncbi:FHA domain-containing protein [Candidatus Oscillochloris fontis]|uniref:FHA domain-containing protein n=1 Tax=Candidatus Oscillochloris fontis TaxID=2496868 RepID=UPI001375D0D3|nr:FHA domain-containing protein [Candidatus Oscillochloris fontis]